MLNKLTHPAIPKVYATYKQPERHYIVREYVAGRSLYELVKANGTLPPKDIYGVVLKLCDVLAYLHGQEPPVIHRDIKPQNIIVAPDGGIHLIDFGISRVHKEDQRQDTVIILTEKYAPPEQYGYDQTSPLADIYSLGVTILFMATGHEEKTGLDRQIKDKTLRRLIEKCIAFDPKARPQNVQDIVQYIKRNTGAKKNRRRALLALLLALVVACSALPAYYLGSNSGMRSGAEIGYTDGHRAGVLEAPEFALREVPYDPHAGNTPGNILAGGFVARSENEIFYIQNSEIFKMGLDGTQAQLLIRDADARGLGYHEGKLYYATYSGINRADPKTGKTENISDISTETLMINDDFIYLENSRDLLHLYRMDLDGGNVVKLNDTLRTLYLNIVGEKMYFVTDDDRKLYSSNLDGSDTKMLYDKTCDWACVYDDMIYSHYHDGRTAVLMRMGLDGQNPEVVWPEPASYINASSSGIFYTSAYSKENEQTLEWISHDGKRRLTVLEGEIGAFNVAGEWIFYENLDDGDALWRIRLDGTENQKV